MARSGYSDDCDGWALLPCPFCGGKATLYGSSDHSTAWEGGCGNMQCPVEPQVWELTKAEAIAAWNRRPPAPEVTSMQGASPLVHPATHSDWLDDGGPLREGWQISIGPGHAGFGCYAHMTEYPDEGALCLATFDPKEYPDARGVSASAHQESGDGHPQE